MNTALHQAQTLVFIKAMGVTFALASAFLLTALSHAQPSVTATGARSPLEYSYPDQISPTHSTDPQQENKKQIQAPGKSSSKDDSRELSAFFAIGIAINVILAIVFTWWFRKEWKKSSHPRTNR